MKNITLFVKFFAGFALALLLAGINHEAYSQLSASVSYDYFPFRNLANPDTEPVDGKRNFTQDLQVEVATFDAGLAFPLEFSEGKTTLVNEFSFQHLFLNYRNWNIEQGGNFKVEDAYAVEYSLTLLHKLSPKWSLITIVTPGLASDFKAKISSDDFTFQAIAGLGRHFSEKLTFYFGLGYFRDFGEPLLFPAVRLEWDNGSNLKATVMPPLDVELWYLPNQALELGLLIKTAGNQYHGDPDIYGADNPQLRYSVTTLGPSARVNILPWLHLNLEGGITFLRRFEFFDGDEEALSIDLEQTGFFRVGFDFGQ
jgi:hypothetical protein